MLQCNSRTFGMTESMDMRESLLEATMPAAARMTNVALTAQVQIAYACATAAVKQAERAAACIERSWPDTPLRTIVVGAYRSQACQSRNAQQAILRQARRRCGLAFARMG
jgi:hypothetical protein